MNKESLNSILKSIKTAIMTSRPAYKDFIYKKEYDKVIEIVNTTITEDWNRAELNDKTVTEFVSGEEYIVSIDSTEYKVIAQQNDDYPFNILVIDDFQMCLGIYIGNLVMDADPSAFIGKTISVKYTKHIIEEKYDIKKLPEECLPDSIDKFKKNVQKQNANVNQQLDNLNSNKDSLWNYYNTVYSKATKAQTTANTAQTTANTALTRAKVIPDMFASKDEDSYIANKLYGFDIDKTNTITHDFSCNNGGKTGMGGGSWNESVLSNTVLTKIEIKMLDKSVSNEYFLIYSDYLILKAKEIEGGDLQFKFPVLNCLLNKNYQTRILDLLYTAKTTSTGIYFQVENITDIEGNRYATSLGYKFKIAVEFIPISNIQKLNGDLVTTASSEIMGTVKANAKTEDQTLPVGIDDSGFLWTKKTDVPQPDWNQNDQTASDYIKNRIGGYETIIDPITISWDGNTEGKTVVNDQLFLVSTETPTIDQLIGGTIKLTIVENGETTSESYTITEDAVNADDNGNIVLGEFCIIIHSPGTAFNTTFEASGIYFAGMFSETQTVYVSELTTVSANGIIKIPEKYLDAATKDQVNTAQTTANTAKTTAETAQSTAETAQSTAETAQTTAETVTNAVKKVILSTVSFTFDKVTSGRDTFKYNGFNYYKISDFCPSLTDVISFDGTIENGLSYSSINTLLKANNNFVKYGLFIVATVAGTFIPDGFSVGITVPSPGLYAKYTDGNDSQTAGTGIFTIASIPTNEVAIQSTGLNLQTLINDVTKNYKVAISDGSLCITDISDNTSKKLATEDYVTNQLKSLPVDGTTITLNDQGQLTLALSNANGVSF